MRSYHKGWQDKRPAPTRRVKWYQGPDTMALPIRLEFMDQGGKVSQWYEDEQTATYDYELFIAGGLNVSNILNAM